jgi:hypothetical protein
MDGLGTSQTGYRRFGPIAIEASESALDNPAPGQDDKPLCRVAAFDDLGEQMALAPS